MNAVANSAGVDRPRTAIPADAADCHLHIYDPRFPLVHAERLAVANASTDEYRKLQRRLGTSRAVVVQPAAYGTDNRVTVDAVARLGRESARGVAVVHPTVTEAELDALHDGGVRGVRFSMHDPRTAVTTPGMIAPLAPRLAARGWHLQLHVRAPQLVELASTIEALPCDVVFDHMARLPLPEGVRHPAWGVVMKRIDQGRAWVKLSGPYLEGKGAAGLGYTGITAVARAFVAGAPERLVWGSDWPHPTEREAKPDAAVLLDRLAEWAPDEAARKRILVDNPAILYGFGNPTAARGS